MVGINSKNLAQQSPPYLHIRSSFSFPWRNFHFSELWTREREWERGLAQRPTGLIRLLFWCATYISPEQTHSFRHLSWIRWFRRRPTLPSGRLGWALAIAAHCGQCSQRFGRPAPFLPFSPPIWAIPEELTRKLAHSPGSVSCIPSLPCNAGDRIRGSTGNRGPNGLFWGNQVVTLLSRELHEPNDPLRLCATATATHHRHQSERKRESNVCNTNSYGWHGSLAALFRRPYTAARGV